MTRDEYNILFRKYSSGQCTHEECQIIENYQDEFELSNMEWDKTLMGNSEKVKDSIRQKLHNEINRKERTRKVNFGRWVAAASIILISITGLLYFKADEKPKLQVKTQQGPRFNQDIEPGDKKAILTLDDGTHINLDDAENGLLARENNTSIEKLPDGMLHYAAGAQHVGTIVRYNTVSTPKGGEFQISLPDGSKVWLNAGSSIRFPTTFTGLERRVELKGEAYFEIAKNALMPFKVLAKNSEIQVLGTHFNVMAYDDERSMNTTLLEGSVQVKKGSDMRLIKPGQSVVVTNSSGNMDVVASDTEQVVAWKNGYFMFSNENIESIMRKVSRWYDVEVSYEGNMTNKDFTGTISRNEKVSEVLKMLELTGAIHFNINSGDAAGKGRRIIVMP